MSAARTLTPATVIPLSASAKVRWPLGEERVIASGTLDERGQLVAANRETADWSLSVASVEKAGDIAAAPGVEHTLTVIAGELLEVNTDEGRRAVELFRPLHWDGADNASLALPTGDVLTLKLHTKSAAARGTVRIIELSNKREQHLFDGQFGVLLQGKATVHSAAGEQTLAVRDTVLGGDEAEPRITGRGFLAIVSLDRT